MRGDLLYRCRLCGGVFSGRTAANVALALDVIRGERPCPAPEDWGHTGPAALETARHVCPSGEIGIGDIAGGRATPPAGGGDVKTSIESIRLGGVPFPSRPAMARRQSDITSNI